MIAPTERRVPSLVRRGCMGLSGTAQAHHSFAM